MLLTLNTSFADIAKFLWHPGAFDKTARPRVDVDAANGRSKAFENLRWH